MPKENNVEPETRTIAIPVKTLPNPEPKTRTITVETLPNPEPKTRTITVMGPEPMSWDQIVSGIRNRAVRPPKPEPKG